MTTPDERAAMSSKTAGCMFDSCPACHTNADEKRLRTIAVWSRFGVVEALDDRLRAA